jgi:C1A family cysteine protease
VTTPVPETRKIQRYGWIPDLPDHRDHLYAAPPEVLEQLPPSVDLREGCPKTVYDQGHLGSCTANAIAGAFEFDLLRQGLRDFMPSRLFIYYNERAREGTVPCDSGAMIRDGIKSVVKQGVCDENEWAYDIARFADQPPGTCYTDAKRNRAAGYQRVPRTLNQFKGCLAHGYPIVFGFRVYQSFESPEVARTGVVPMPAPGEEALGGHAVLAVGYDDATGRFLVRNSWGPDWGDGGYFTLPYGYLTDRGLSSDFWALLQVTCA